MNLLMFNLKLDRNDPPLAFTNDWVNAFAQQVDELHLITMEKGIYQVPDNVKIYTIGLGKAVPKWKKIARFYRHLFHILRTTRIDGCFSHMQPVFSALAGPVLKLSGIPLVSWYAHPKVHFILKTAHFFSTYTVASLYESYPYKKNKLRVIGQGIDTELFKNTVPRSAASPARILYSGRLSRVKNVETFIEALGLLQQHGGPAVVGEIVGNAQGSEDTRYEAALKQQVQVLGLTETVVFRPALPRHALPALNVTADLYVNMTPTGSGDKVVWEAMACETPVLAANQGFAETMGQYADILLFEYGNAVDMQQKIAHFLALSPEKRADIGAYLRQQVLRLHSLEALPGKVLSLMQKQ